MLSLVIPTYNECDSIGVLIKNVNKILKKNYEIIVVDDNSPDGTSSLVEEISKKNKQVRLIKRNKRGLSSAIITGFEAAKGEILGVMDADLSHDETILPLMLEKIKTHDLVVGSRRVKGGGAHRWSLWRKAVSNIANYIAISVLGVKIKDAMSGYFLIKRELYDSCKESLDKNDYGYKILLEIYYKAKPKNVIEIPFIFKNRRQGESKLNGKIIIRYVLQIIKLRMGVN